MLCGAGPTPRMSSVLGLPSLDGKLTHSPPLPSTPRSSNTWMLCIAGPEITLSQQRGPHGISIQDIQDDQEAATEPEASTPQEGAGPGKIIRTGPSLGCLPGTDTYIALGLSDKTA